MKLFIIAALVVSSLLLSSAKPTPAVHQIATLDSFCGKIIAKDHPLQHEFYFYFADGVLQVGFLQYYQYNVGDEYCSDIWPDR